MRLNKQNSNQFNISVFTFFILWPITPVDSINTSSGFSWSSFYNKKGRLNRWWDNEMPWLDIYLHEWGTNHSIVSLPLQGHLNILSHPGNQHHPEIHFQIYEVHNWVSYDSDNKLSGWQRIFIFFLAAIPRLQQQAF